MEPHLRDELASGARVRLHEISKSYGDSVAVHALALATEAGEFFTILGPSGSGKTTTLKMIAGFVTPTRGEIYVDDRNVTELPPQTREIGMVFQNYALFPHLSVFENVAFALRVRRVPMADIRERVRAALAMVRLGELEGRLPHQLSGGQQQRVAFARAIVFGPRVLLLDEPLGALDKKLREHMQVEIKQLQRKLQVTVLYITHDQEEAMTMSDRVAVMNLGRVEQVGTPSDLYDRPVNRFVAAFLGESNFMAGTVAVSRSGEVKVRLDDGADVWGRSAVAFAEGERLSLALRPEHLWLGSAPTAEYVNAVSGTIRETVHLGDAVRYRIGLASGLELTAKLPRRSCQAQWANGTLVSASWRPGDMTLFRED